jgi:hypothetical protein
VSDNSSRVKKLIMLFQKLHSRKTTIAGADAATKFSLVSLLQFIIVEEEKASEVSPFISNNVHA